LLNILIIARHVSIHIFDRVFAGQEPVMPMVGDQQVNVNVTDFADPVAKLVNIKFAELTDNLKSPYARRKVLAGFVLTRDNNFNEGQVICVATGTKCIFGEYMSEKGLSLNDSHAEVLARRALKKYFYDQLKFHLDPNPEMHEQSIFEKREGGGFKIKPNIDIHLYISTSPCGDARIFSPHENQDGRSDNHPNRKARGLLRTKIECGEGTIPVKSQSGIQTWDGIMQGERLLTMSCSDKIARWNVLGLQGIYWSSDSIIIILQNKIKNFLHYYCPRFRCSILKVIGGLILTNHKIFTAAVKCMISLT
jgi:double stranded RNA-specific editase B